MAEQRQDPDRRLTEAFGRWLDGEAGVNESEDPILPVLNTFRTKRKELVSVKEREDAWKRISSGMTRASVRQMPVKKQQRWIWAVAASILLAAFVGYFSYFSSSKEVLLTESFSAQTEFILDDGSSVLLRPNSRLFLIQQNETHHDYRIEGEGFFKVASSQERIFRVTASEATVEVLGTRFNLSSWGDNSRVYLEEGSIRLIHASTNNTVTLSPGQSARTIGGGAFSVDENAQAEEFLDWRDGEIVFSELPFSEIIPELEQHFGIILRVPEQVSQTVMNGAVSLTTADETLRFIGLLLDGEFSQEETGVYVFTLNSR